jgi:hydrogenase maturation factor
MHSNILLIIIFCHSSVAILQFTHPKQTFELPNHPFNWICTVHIAVATFENYTTSDITERFLASNREKIIPTVSTMLNRSAGVAPVNSFFEPCVISVLIDATIYGSSYVFKGHRLYTYIIGNEYVYRGWRHSLIILVYFSCNYEYID